MTRKKNEEKYEPLREEVPETYKAPIGRISLVKLVKDHSRRIKALETLICNSIQQEQPDVAEEKT